MSFPPAGEASKASRGGAARDSVHLYALRSSPGGGA